MPRRSKKSRARSAFHSTKLQNTISIDDKNPEREINNKEPECEIVKENNVFEIVVNGIQITYSKLIYGHFHQGDSQFSEQSKGLQCSCNSLAMLCCVPDICNMTSNDLDQILRHGDQLYRNTCQNLNAAGQLANEYLHTGELPKSCTLGNMTYTIHYEPERYGRLDTNPGSIFETLDIELQAAFNVSNLNILIFPPYMMAIYYHEATGQYIFFDSHSRDKCGFPTSEGTAVALYFQNIDNLFIYLSVLAETLPLDDRRFLIQPVSINANKHDSIETNIVGDNVAIDVESEPGCSTWTSDAYFHTACNETDTALDSTDNESTYCPSTSSRQPSRYQKWFQNLSTERQEEIRENKRKRSKDHYQISENAKT